MKIHLAYKSTSTSKIDEKAEQSITKHRLQKLPAVQLKDAKYKIIIFENVFEHFSDIDKWFYELQLLMSRKFDQSFNSFNFRIPNTKTDLTGISIEDVVIDEDGQFKQNCYLELSLIGVQAII